MVDCHHKFAARASVLSLLGSFSAISSSISHTQKSFAKLAVLHRSTVFIRTDGWSLVMAS